VIRAEVIEVAQEIEEVEVEDEIKREEEEEEGEEEELELENEVGTVDEQEKEFVNNDESKEIISETSIAEDAITSSSQLTNTTFVGMIPSPIDYKAEKSMKSNVVEDTTPRDKIVIEEEEGITKVEQPQSEISPTVSTLPNQSSTVQYPLEQTSTANQLPLEEQAIENTLSVANKGEEEDSKEATPLGNVTYIHDGDEGANATEAEDGNKVVAADSNGSSISNSQASLIVQQLPPPITQPQMERPLVTEPLFQSSDSELANIGGYNNIPDSPIDLPNVGDTVSDTP